MKTLTSTMPSGAATATLEVYALQHGRHVEKARLCKEVPHPVYCFSRENHPKKTKEIQELHSKQKEMYFRMVKPSHSINDFQQWRPPVFKEWNGAIR